MCVCVLNYIFLGLFCTQKRPKPDKFSQKGSFRGGFVCVCVPILNYILGTNYIIFLPRSDQKRTKSPKISLYGRPHL